MHLRMKRLALVFLLCALSFLSFASCSDSTVGPPKHPYGIVATTAMVADITRNIAGDKATVEGLMGEGVDPHLYKPTRNDIAKVLNADVVFYSGLMLEGRMADTFINAANKGRKVFPVTNMIEEKWLLEPDEFAGHWDPHVWMDVSAWDQCAQAVADELSDFDPDNKSYYQTNAAAYRKQLDALHAYVKKSISSIPENKRVLITAHDAFNYFGRAYDIKVKGVQGLSTESEAGLSDINGLVDFIVKNKIEAVFVESSVSDKNVRALIEGAKSKGHDLRIGGELFSDAMGKEGTYEGTYIGMLDHNATIIARALGGEAPAKGLNGKLSGKH